MMDAIDELEAEAISILREVAGQYSRSALLFSGGKDSIALARLSEKAFRPGRFPYPLLHIDTGHNFPEAIEYRDRMAADLGEELLVRRVQDSIDAGKAVEETGKGASRNALQSITLLDAVAEFRFEALIGGARRDEEKARAKERVFSLRDEFGQWDPKRQRPELWNLYNGRLRPGEHVRVFPLSNWTELDVWEYLRREGVELPSLYFSHSRKVVRRGAALFPVSPFVHVDPGEEILESTVRFRTVGDMTCTAAVESRAATLDAVVEEIRRSRESERGSRLDDQRSEAAMEERKKQGYF
ncbi:MAG: sulfate adenylyltransferase subunit CysD [Spirochaetes bacterium]|nr:sulfate adenylyltransferase subunit CysD [Spirochaetota bacterium]